MKRILLTFVLLLLTFTCAAARNNDPILDIWDNSADSSVVQCCENAQIRIHQDKIQRALTLYGRYSPNGFLVVPVSLLFQQNLEWSGLNPRSFTLIYTDRTGTEQQVELNIPLTCVFSSQISWDDFSVPVNDPAYLRYQLVFELPVYAGKDWRLKYQPMSRDGWDSLCSVRVPFTVN